MPLGAPSSHSSSTRLGRLAGLIRSGEPLALVFAGAAQALVLLYVLRLWGGWLPLTVPMMGLVLIFGLIPAAAPLRYWGALSRHARGDGGIAPAAAELLRPLAPLLASTVVLCYWWGRCALAALGLTAIVESLAPHLGLHGADLNWLAAGLLAAHLLPGGRTLTALFACCAALAAPVLGFYLISRGVGVPVLLAGLQAGGGEHNGFSLAGSVCAALFLVGPSLCSYEGLFAFSVAGARRQGQGGRLATGALIGTVLTIVVAWAIGTKPVPPAQGAAQLAELAPTLLLIAAGVLALQLSRGAAVRVLPGLWRPRLRALLSDGQRRLVAGITAIAILGFFTLRDSSWLYAGAGLAYFVALAGVAAPTLVPLAMRHRRRDNMPPMLFEFDRWGAPVAVTGRAALAAALVWLAGALFGLQAWGMQGVLIGLAMVCCGGVFHTFVRALRRRSGGVAGALRSTPSCWPGCC